MKVIIRLVRLNLMLRVKKTAAAYNGANAPSHLSLALTANDIFDIAGIASTPLAIPGYHRCRI